MSEKVAPEISGCAFLTIGSRYAQITSDYQSQLGDAGFDAGFEVSWSGPHQARLKLIHLSNSWTHPTYI